MNITVLDGYAANPGDISWDAISRLGQLTVYERTTPSQVIERSKDADAILTNKVIIDKDIIRQLPRLKYIGVLATGYNIVDIDYAHAQGIVVTNIPAYSTDSVAQKVFAHLLNVTDDVAHYVEENRKGRWTEAPDFCYIDAPLHELSQLTMGIYGLGNIGTRVAEIAHAFGMTLYACTSKSQDQLPPYIIKKSATELLSESDVISLHCPLTDDTRGLINAETLKHVKPSAIIINTGRGPLVDDNAVAQALSAGKLGAYCADVLTIEPAQADNPLLSAPRSYLTPHIAWATVEARQRLMDIAANNIKAFIQAKPQNVV